MTVRAVATVIVMGMCLALVSGCPPPEPPPLAAVSIGAPSVTDTNTGPVTFTLTYTNAVSVTLTVVDVVLNATGTAAGDVSVSGTGLVSRTVTISNTMGIGELGISIAGGTASNEAGELAAGAGPSTTFNVDDSAPTLSIGAPSLSDTNTGPVTYAITYSGAESVTLAVGDVTLSTTGDAAGTLSVAGTGSSTRTVTISDITGDGEIGISIAAGTASDIAGNLTESAGPSTTFNADNTAPTLSISAPSVTAADAASGPVTYTGTYTGANSVSLTVDDVTLNATDSATGTVTVSGEGPNTRTITITDNEGIGELGITIAPGTASDLAGNLAAGAGPSETYSVFNPRPTLSISDPSVTDTNIGPVTFTVTYSGAQSVTLTTGDISLALDGMELTPPDTPPVSVSGTGTDSRVIMVSDIDVVGALTISILAGTATDSVGNLADEEGPSAAVNVLGPQPTLVPGAGFTGATPTPTQVGSGPGADAKAIARWDVVPYQRFDGIFEIGVVAFHINGIDRVEFSADGGPFTPAVPAMTLNTRTGVTEYWVNLDANLFTDGPVEVRAIAYPTVGVPRLLGGDAVEFGNGEHSMFLFANGQQSFVPEQLFVSLTGDDSAPGTIGEPLATIKQALEIITDGGEVILVDPGTYDGPNRSQIIDNERWVTVRAADDLTAGDIIISRPEVFPNWTGIRPKLNRLRWKNVSFDFGQIAAYTAIGNRQTWYDQCKWFNSFGWTSRPGRSVISVGDHYATGCTADDMLRGFTNTILVRGCDITMITGDVLQNSRALFNNTVTTTNGLVLPIHTDLYQMWGETDNVIIYGLQASDLLATQSFFLQPTLRLPDPSAPQDAMRNTAFVNCDIRNVPEFINGVDRGGPPFSQMQSKFEHVLFLNVSLPTQLLVLRTDFIEGERNQFFNAKNVLFKNVDLHPITFSVYCDPTGPFFQVVDGVRFEECTTSGKLNPQKPVKPPFSMPSLHVPIP